MKTPRKLTSLLLALLLVFALAATAAAEDAAGTTTGSITVDNPITGRTYTAYKIFDVVYEEPTTKNHYSYTIKDDSAWYPTVSGYATEANGLTLTQVADTTANTYVVTFDEVTFSAPSFAAALNDALTTVGPVDVHPFTANADGKQVADKLPLGYYFVKSSDNKALCNLTTTNPSVTIHDKNNVPFEKTKTVEKNDFNVGDTVTFTITGKVPDYTGFTEYTYEITDKMTDGLTFNRNSLTVKVGEATVTEGCTIAYEPTTAPQTFTVSIPVLGNKYVIGAEIKVTYTATVNEKAVAVVSQNEAKLTYSNDPTNTEKKATTPSEIVKVYSSKIVIKKVEKTDGTDGKPLSGAEFVLYKEVKTVDGGEATKQYYKWNAGEKKVQWVAQAEADTVKTNVDGEASFDGLADGTYHLVEIKAPAGYNQLKDPVTVTVAGSNKDDETGKLIVTQKVENQAGTLLPSTGGMGTTVFYVLGAVLVVGAGVLLVTKKRMSRNEG